MKSVHWLWFGNRLFFQDAASFNKYFVHMWSTKIVLVLSHFWEKKKKKKWRKTWKRGQNNQKTQEYLSLKMNPIATPWNFKQSYLFLDRLTHPCSPVKYRKSCKKCWKTIYLKYIRWAMQYLYKKPLKRPVKNILCIMEKQMNPVSQDTIPILRKL